jgi:L-alanine-DL-glutamate epimerase-like enolase superfamily enzyme
MKITDVESMQVRVPRRRFEGNQWTVRGGFLDAINHLIVRIHTDDGFVGYGEGCALEDPSIPYHQLVERHFKDELIGKNPFNVARIVADLEAKEMLLFENTVGPLNVAEEAIEIALYDIIGKALNTPIYNLLGGLQRDRIPVDWIIGIGLDPVSTAEQARHAAHQGFQVIKLKGGRDVGHDLARVQAVREAVGPKVRIRVDWNQALTPKQAVRVINQMDEYGLYMAEQPTPSWDLRGLAYVRQNVTVPILADESLWTPHDAIRIIQADAADALFVYLYKSPGLYRSAIISHIADSAGLGTAFCNVFGLGIGTAAGLHLSAARQINYFECGYHGILYAQDNEDLLVEPIGFADGHWSVPQGPGLGVEVDEDKLEKCRVRD